MHKMMRILHVFALLLLLTTLLASCTSLSQSNNERTITIAVVEDNPGDEGNPNSQSTYAGVLFAASQFTQRTNINVVVPYAAAEIPVLNAMPITETLTDDHPYYFNTT